MNRGGDPHHLVKHYHDGRLQSGHVNDPEQDAKLVFDVLEDQIEAFELLNATTPDALIAYHFLRHAGRQDSGGFDRLFQQIRGAGTPTEAEAQEGDPPPARGSVPAARGSTRR